MWHGGRQRDLLCFELSKPSVKPELNGCTLALGDAEQIPYETDRFDRYVSAGSLEYWPDPTQGIEGWAIG